MNLNGGFASDQVSNKGRWRKRNRRLADQPERPDSDAYKKRDRSSTYCDMRAGAYCAELVKWSVHSYVHSDTISLRTAVTCTA